MQRALPRPQPPSVNRPATVAGMAWRDRWAVQGWLASGWLMQAQILAIAALGVAVLMPFAMAAGIIAGVAAIVLLGPIGLVRLVRRGEGAARGAAGHGDGRPSEPEP